MWCAPPHVCSDILLNRRIPPCCPTCLAQVLWTLQTQWHSRFNNQSGTSNGSLSMWSCQEFHCTAVSCLMGWEGVDKISCSWVQIKMLPKSHQATHAFDFIFIIHINTMHLLLLILQKGLFLLQGNLSRGLLCFFQTSRHMLVWPVANLLETDQTKGVK